jgi:hypothetical protein
LLNANPAALQSSSAETCDIVDADDPMARGTYGCRHGAVMAPPSLHLQIFRTLFALVWNVFKPYSAMRAINGGWLRTPSMSVCSGSGLSSVWNPKLKAFFAARHKR